MGGQDRNRTNDLPIEADRSTSAPWLPINLLNCLFSFNFFYKINTFHMTNNSHTNWKQMFCYFCLDSFIYSHLHETKTRQQVTVKAGRFISGVSVVHFIINH